MSKQNGPGANAGDSDSIYRAPASDTTPAPKGDLLAAYVGPKNADYYSRRFEQFKTGGGAVSWNWPAFLITSVWLLYRKMWLNAFLYWLILPVVLGLLSIAVTVLADESVAAVFYYATYTLIAFLLVPIFANRLYFRHAQGKVDRVAAAVPSAEQQAAELARIGGTSRIVFVLVPVMLIAVAGILAAIAIPAYQDYMVRAQVAEGLNLAAGAQAAVVEQYTATGVFADTNEAAGLLPADSITGTHVASVSIDGGSIVITYGNQAHEAIHGQTIVLVPEVASDDTVFWDCSSPSIAPPHLPASCR